MNYLSKIWQFIIITIQNISEYGGTKKTVIKIKKVEKLNKLDTDYLFDNLARSTSGALTRRDAFKLTITGLVGIGLSRIGISSAWAGTTCLCNGVTPFDPSSSCCVPSGVVSKHPADLIRCLGTLVPHNYTCSGGYCGPEGGTRYPDQYGTASFLKACQDHDCCYGTCQANKSSCDNIFLAEMLKACTFAYPPVDKASRILFSMCSAVALTYSTAVRTTQGQAAFSVAQSFACDCCGSQACSCPAEKVCASANNYYPSCCNPNQSCWIGSSGHAKCCDVSENVGVDSSGNVYCCPKGTFGFTDKDNNSSCMPCNDPIYGSLGNNVCH